MKTSASYLKHTILRCISELNYYGKIDLTICDDVYTHWKRDIEKLLSFHGHDHGVALEKVIGYLSFWIRKLKPISNPIPINLDEEGEVVFLKGYSQSLINELVSIYIVKIFILDYCNEKVQESVSQEEKDHYSSVKSNVEINFDLFFSTLGSSEFRKSFLSSCLYDMRYRTFGPHHVVHVVRAFLAGVNLRFINNSFCAGDILFTPRNKILLMQVFVSAPGDVQKKKLSGHAGSDGLIIRIFKNNHKKWIKQFNVAVIPIYQGDLESRLAKKSKSVQNEILRQLYEEKLMDVYCGIIDSKFGNPVDGFGSGTIAEYTYARENLDNELIMFGKNETPDIDIENSEHLQQTLLIRNFFNREGNDGLLYWSYQEDKSGSNFEQKLIEQIEKKITTFKEKFS